MTEKTSKPDRRVTLNTPEQERAYHETMARKMKEKGYENLAQYHDLLARKGSV